MTAAEPASPNVAITYCRLCGWLLRAAWMAQELLSTFAEELGSVTLIPDDTGGVFEVRIDGRLLWSRAEHRPLSRDQGVEAARARRGGAGPRSRPHRCKGTHALKRSVGATGRSRLAPHHMTAKFVPIERVTREMSQPVVVTIPHKLGKEEAARRLKSRLRQCALELRRELRRAEGRMGRRSSRFPREPARPDHDRHGRCRRRPCAARSAAPLDAGAACQQGQGLGATQGKLMLEKPSKPRPKS